MKKNIIALGTYPVDNPHGGGKYVIYHLFKRLSKKFNIRYFSLIESDKLKKEISITPNFVNIQIPQNTEQAKIQWELEKKQNQVLFDVIQINHWNLNSDFVEEIRKNLNTSDLIILEHPFLVNLIKNLNTDKPVVYHAHNIEFFQKKSILDYELLNQVKEAEKLACEMSEQIWASSNTEKESFEELYGISQEKIRILPHGVDISETPFFHSETKKKAKNELDLSKKTIFVFTGSWHPPNLEALEFIISKLAPLNENFEFFVIGSVKDQYLAKYPRKDVSKNVKLLGMLSDKEKFKIYQISDFAINPMFSGAGTNLKMLEYMAVGLPIISTEFGSRGLKISDKTKVCSKNAFLETIKNIKNSGYENSSSIKKNYDIVNSEYSYESIAKNCANYIFDLLNPPDERLAVFEKIPHELNAMGIQKNDNLVLTVSKEIESLISSKF